MQETSVLASGAGFVVAASLFLAVVWSSYVAAVRLLPRAGSSLATHRVQSLKFPIEASLRPEPAISRMASPHKDFQATDHQDLRGRGVRGLDGLDREM